MRTTLFLLLLPTLALAQVSTNDQAIEQLGPAKPVPAHPAPHHARAVAHPAHTTRPAHGTVAGKLGAPPPVAAAPPPNPVILPPPLVLPAHKPLPLPPIPVRADAKGSAGPLPAGGLRLTFGPGSADLNPAMADALQRIADHAKAQPAMTVTITAWAPGPPDDPSTPRRLSLDRALAARAVLLHAGVLSDRIHALAKGPAGIGDGPPDRADLAEVLPPPPKAPDSAAPAPVAPPR